MASLNSTLTPLCASLDATFKMIADARSEQQVLKNEMRLVLDALRADVHGSREAVMLKVDNSLNDLRGPMGQLVASEAQNARLIDALRAQVDGLRAQVANVAQTQQTQAQQAPPEPAPSFAGHKKMFPIEGLTSKVSFFFLFCHCLLFPQDGRWRENSNMGMWVTCMMDVDSFQRYLASIKRLRLWKPTLPSSFLTSRMRF